ncbi:MAG: hypothetical protein ACLQG3_14975 [Terracidiphilus sp.]
MRYSESLCALGVAALAVLATHAIAVPLPGASDDDPDVNEVRQYQLTMDKAQEAATAMQSINQLVAANPGLSAAMNAGSDSTSKKTITQQAHDIDSLYPQVAAVIRQNGLATREFIVVTGALINDVGWVGLKKQGAIKDYPPGMITPRNAALIEANWDAFQTMSAKMIPPSAN